MENCGSNWHIFNYMWFEKGDKAVGRLLGEGSHAVIQHVCTSCPWSQRPSRLSGWLSQRLCSRSPLLLVSPKARGNGRGGSVWIYQREAAEFFLSVSAARRRWVQSSHHWESTVTSDIVFRTVYDLGALCASLISFVLAISVYEKTQYTEYHVVLCVCVCACALSDIHRDLTPVDKQDDCYRPSTYAALVMCHFMFAAAVSGTVIVIYRWGNLDTDRLSNFLVTQLINSRGGIWTQLLSALDSTSAALSAAVSDK